MTYLALATKDHFSFKVLGKTYDIYLVTNATGGWVGRDSGATHQLINIHSSW